MPQDRPKITFYVDDDVKEWWDSRPQGEGGRILNKLIRDHCIEKITVEVTRFQQGWLAEGRLPDGQEVSSRFCQIEADAVDECLAIIESLGANKESVHTERQPDIFIRCPLCRATSTQTGRIPGLGTKFVDYQCGTQSIWHQNRLTIAEGKCKRGD